MRNSHFTRGFFLMIAFSITFQVGFSQASSGTEWTNKTAAKWFKSKEWGKGLALSAHGSVDKVEFAKQYHKNTAVWDKAFTFLKEQKLDGLAPGKYPIDGDNVYATVTEAPLKEFEKSNWESHRKYIDLQYVIKGKEKIGVAQAAKATVTKPYDEKTDLVNYTADGKFYVAQPGYFFLFFPQNAHRPSIKVPGFDVDKKLVIKIRVAE